MRQCHKVSILFPLTFVQLAHCDLEAQITERRQKNPSTAWRYPADCLSDLVPVSLSTADADEVFALSAASGTKQQMGDIFP